MTMDPGWHTYWRHPGDSGIAPTFDWSKSQNVAEIEVLWPAPLRFDQPGDMTIGYKDRIVRSKEHTSELQSLMRLSYAVFCLKKKKDIKGYKHNNTNNIK